MILLYSIISYVEVIALIVCAVLLLRDKRDHDSKLVANSFIIASIALIFRFVVYYSGAEYAHASSPTFLLVSMLLLISFSLYPLRKSYPERFIGWAILRPFILPASVVAIVYCSTVFGVRYEHFSPSHTSLSHIFSSFSQLFTFVILIVNVIFSIYLLIIAYRHVELRFVRLMSLIVPFMALVVVAVFFLPASVHQYVALLCEVVILLYAVAVTYMLLVQKIVVVDLPTALSREELLLNRIWEHLEEFMRTEEPWRIHDIKLETLAQMVGTNRTTLSSVIHYKGFDSFHDYVANYRIAAFCAAIDTAPSLNITSLFVEVGFQSPSSAYKHFKRVHGVTPSQYLMKRTRGRQK